MQPPSCNIHKTNQGFASSKIKIVLFVAGFPLGHLLCGKLIDTTCIQFFVFLVRIHLEISTQNPDPV
jgi:hypothetical protein